MTPRTPKQTLLAIVKAAESHDFELAKETFAKLSPEQMDKPYGLHCPLSPNELLAQLRQQRQEWEAAYNLVNALEDTP